MNTIIEVGPQGKIAIPEAFLKKNNWQPGDELVLDVDSNGFTLYKKSSIGNT